jgi:colicin import membrane protein
MRLRKNPGWLISGAAHAALLSAILFGFFRASEVVDPHEAVPVEVVDGRELDRITKGEKTAPSVKPRPRAEKRADVPEPKPLPPIAEAAKDVAPPPAPAKRQPEPGQDTSKEAQKPAQKSAAVEPAQRPADPPRPEPKPRPVKPSVANAPHPPAKVPPPEDAEPLEPKPVPKPKVAQKPEPQKDTKPQIVAKKAEPRFEPDRLAKLLEQDKQTEPAEKRAEKPVARPKSGDETAAPEKKFDATDISKFLSKEDPRRKASSGPELQQLASLGAPTASAAKMSPSLWDQLDGLLQDQYKRCWTFVGLGGQKKYVPEIRVQYAENGSLAQMPELLNPPSDPNLKALADSALRAVRRCDPLRIPARYQPYFEQWKGRIVRFDPEEML